jgi:hypothetical protein
VRDALDAGLCHRSCGSFSPFPRRPEPRGVTRIVSDARRPIRSLLITRVGARAVCVALPMPNPRSHPALDCGCPLSSCDSYSWLSFCFLMPSVRWDLTVQLSISLRCSGRCTRFFLTPPPHALAHPGRCQSRGSPPTRSHACLLPFLLCTNPPLHVSAYAALASAPIVPATPPRGRPKRRAPAGEPVESFRFESTLYIVPRSTHRPVTPTRSH